MLPIMKHRILDNSSDCIDPFCCWTDITEHGSRIYSNVMTGLMFGVCIGRGGQGYRSSSWIWICYLC